MELQHIIKSNGLRRRLRFTQRAMERAMLGVYLRDQIIVLIVPRKDGRWGTKMLEWQPRTGKRSVSRLPTRWTDDIKHVAGRRWIKAAQNRGIWNSTQKSPISSSECLSVDMIMMIKTIIGLCKES
ncbi:jg20827 [Pararge aegeria aegeria]|uniref:Jg20827 protein n=1 Tax=Pararge aegeria aegeria TaxID=348720 RepID=A0A8S4RBM1_9NEOP|nr:jg20827 [Pararge aegeria aegeria]